jgi:hypothetical protein
MSINDDQGTDFTQQETINDINSQQEDKPGRRLKNPLGFFSSSTYQISLYMITPDAYDAFILSGRRDINVLNNVDGNQASGAYLVAQSGGINNTDSKRAPGFNLDYYIDNLSIKTYMDPQATMTSSNSTEVKFQIVEPYGFSFLTKLKLAADSLKEYTDALKSPRNPTRQFFILGIRFFGYDDKGNLMKASDLGDYNSKYGIFDRYYDINIINIKFKIDGNASTYSVDAVSIAPSVSFGIKRGRINNDTTVIGKTVQDVLEGPEGLLTKLNKANEENAVGSPNIFSKIRWLGPDAQKIKDATIVLPEDWDKLKYPGINARNTLDVSQVTEDTANPDPTRRQIIFKNDTAIQQAIAQIISQSSYLRDALALVYDSVKEPDTDDGEYKETEVNDPGDKIAWYNLSAEVSEAKWNENISDFVYTITFIIQTYETPVITNAYINTTTKYYGPHKRYDYWYTGKNSEVLNYEQNINNGYFTIALDAKPNTLGNEEIPVALNRQINELRLGRLTVGQEAQNTYITSLFDPGSFVTAKITIMGDPDFLVMESPGSINDVYSRFYGTDRYTITPNGGQVFIEIDFKEAVDYDTKEGVLKINDRILFWKYPEEVPVEGVSYRVIDVVSTFQNGAFKQVLNCVVNTIGGVGDAKSNSIQSTEDGREGRSTDDSGFVGPVFQPGLDVQGPQRPADPET